MPVGNNEFLSLKAFIGVRLVLNPMPTAIIISIISSIHQ